LTIRRDLIAEKRAKQSAAKRKKALLLKLSRDMIGMGRTLFPKMLKKPSPEMHYEITRVLMNPKKRKVNIVAPRGFAKSTIVAALGVIWHIFFEDIFLARRRTPKYVVLTSKTQKHAKKLLGTIKHILDEETKFRALFGDYGHLTAKQWTSEAIRLKDGTLIEAVGTGQQSRGMKEVFQRPTLVILDDPEDEDNTRTMESMDNNFNWLVGALEQTLDSDIGKVWVIGTPLHQKCMVFRLKARGDYETLHFQAIVDGKSQWEEEKPTSRLMLLKESLAAIGKVHLWYQEIQCQIRLGEEAVFREEDYQHYEGYLTRKGIYPYLVITAQGTPVAGKCPRLDTPLVKPVTVIMGVDPASTTTRRSDYFFILAVAMTREGQVYVLPYFRKRVDGYDGAQAIVQMYKQYRPRLVRIEATGFQTMLKSYLSKSREVDVHIPIREEKPERKKLGEGGRIEDTAYLFRAQNVYFQPSMIELMSEFTMYPKPDHDDGMDAFYYATMRMVRPSHGMRAYQGEPEVVDMTADDPMLA
jgi:predicted phage terminase large subunit-like protein